MLTENELSELSYESKLGKSLKNKLKKFNKNEVIEEIKDIIGFYQEKDLTKFDQNIIARIKSLESFLLKWDKNYPSSTLKHTANDILGIRYIINSYNDIDTNNLIGKFRIIDMTNGKAHDDGYRGLHIYYEKDNFNYPIEIQFFTEYDAIFNGWLHDYVYKYHNNEYGIRLKELYDKGIIKNENDFRRELNVLLNS